METNGCSTPDSDEACHEGHHEQDALVETGLP
jgi:hypothetical protein